MASENSSIFKVNTKTEHTLFVPNRPHFFITFQLAVDKYIEEIQWHQMSFKSATRDDQQTVDWQFNLSFRRI